MEEYSKEQLKELYEELPENLKRAVFSSEITETVKKICSKNGLSDCSGILKKVGYVFLGILSPDELKKELENPALFTDINDEVLFNLKSDLDLLYGINIQKTDEPKKGSDKYLEPIE